MKKLVLICLFAVAAGGLATGLTNGSIALSGTVASSLDVVVTPAPAASTLDLITTQTALTIGSAKFTTNRGSWAIRVYSTYGSKLTGAVDSLSYTFTLGSLGSLQNVTLGAGAGNATVQTMTRKTSKNGDTYSASISYTGASNLTEGSYTDTIIIAIALN